MNENLPIDPERNEVASPSTPPISPSRRPLESSPRTEQYCRIKHSKLSLATLTLAERATIRSNATVKKITAVRLPAHEKNDNPMRRTSKRYAPPAKPSGTTLKTECHARQNIRSSGKALANNKADPKHTSGMRTGAGLSAHPHRQNIRTSPIGSANRRGMPCTSLDLASAIRRPARG